jgi:hypothetical protein
VPLARWLAGNPPETGRHPVLGEAARVIRCMHAAGCYIRPGVHPGQFLLVEHPSREVVLANVDDVEGRRRPSFQLALRNLETLHDALAEAGCRYGERAQFLRDYFGDPRSGVAAGRLARQAARRYALTSADWGDHA